jgi:hypothetical protein
MRRLNSNAALAIGIAAIAASGVSGETGCSPTRPTEIVPGALTQVQVPRDLGAIKLTVLANGAQKFCRGYVVGPSGTVELPSTLGVISGAAGTTLTISLRGYDDADSPDINDCEGNLAVDSTDPVNGPGPRVLRQAVVSYVDQHTLFLPMPLSFSCYDKDCSNGDAGSGSTCIANQCLSGGVKALSLAEFTPALVDGTGECFNLDQCFAASVPAAVLDAASCLYTVPAGVTSPAGGLNVRITYTDVAWVPDPGTGVFGPRPGVPLEREILSLDANEGFTIPDAAQPTRFQLAPGLCSLVQNATTPPQPPPSSYHSISNVEVALGCPSKLPLLPFCAGQQTGNVSTSPTPLTCGVPVPLEAAPSALYLVMDDSGSMFGAFGATGYATAMNLSFADPVFRHTYVAFRFLSHLTSECTSPGTVYTTPGVDGGAGVDFGLAPSVQPVVATSLLDWQAPDTFSNPAPLDLQAAMRLDEGAYRHLVDFEHRLNPDGGTESPLNVAAVMFFVNRTPVLPGSVVDGGAAEAGPGGSEFPTTAADCDPSLFGEATVSAALTQEAQNAFAQNLQTYFIVLNDQQNAPQPQLDFYNQVASPPATPATDAGAEAGATEGGGAPAPTGVTVLNATSTLASVFASFQATLTSVATCLYDLPAGVDTTASLSFAVPPGNALNANSFPVPINVVQSSSCKAGASTSASGWNIDNGHIRLCGSACQELQATVGAVAAAALGQGGDGGAEAGLPTVADGGAPAVPDVPVSIVMPCGDGGSP